MAEGDLVLPDGPVGFAEGIDLTEPTNLLEVSSGTALANIVAAIEAGDYRLLLDPGLDKDMGTAQIDPGTKVQIGCLDGTATLDGRNFTAGAMFQCNSVTDIIFFNVRFLQSTGQDSSNNPGGFIEILDGSDEIYFYHVDVEHSLDQAGFADAPEGWNIWNNGSGDATKRVTIHGCETTNNVQPSKMGVFGGPNSAQAGGADNTKVTIYKTVLRSWSRQPLADGGTQIDVVNCVMPRGLNRGGGSGIEVRATSRMDIRGCSIGESNEFTFGELIHNNNGGNCFSYYPLSGAGNDNNIEDGNPVIDADIPSSATPVVTKPYTLNPEPMTPTLRSTVENEAGPGTMAVTIEQASGGGGGPTPLSTEHAAYHNLAASFGQFLVAA